MLDTIQRPTAIVSDVAARLPELTYMGPSDRHQHRPIRHSSPIRHDDHSVDGDNTGAVTTAAGRSRRPE